MLKNVLYKYLRVKSGIIQKLKSVKDYFFVQNRKQLVTENAKIDQSDFTKVRFLALLYGAGRMSLVIKPNISYVSRREVSVALLLHETFPPYHVTLPQTKRTTSCFFRCGQ